MIINLTERERQYLMSMIANRIREIREGHNRPEIVDLLQGLLEKVKSN